MTFERERAEYSLSLLDSTDKFDWFAAAGFIAHNDPFSDALRTEARDLRRFILRGIQRARTSDEARLAWLRLRLRAGFEREVALATIGGWEATG